MPPTIPQETTSGTPSAADPQRDLHTLLTSAAIAPLDGTGWIESPAPTASAGSTAWSPTPSEISSPAQAPTTSSSTPRAASRATATSSPSPSASCSRPPPRRSPTSSPCSTASSSWTTSSSPTSPPPVTASSSPAPRPPISLPPSTSARPVPHPSLTHLSFRDQPLTLIHAYSPLVPRFELWAEDLTAVSAELQTRGAAPCTPATLDLLRILEGTPLFGTDIRDRDLPQETDATRALHFTKGCYLGQEIVERIRSRGQVHRTFGGFTLSGALAQPGTPLTVEGKPVGELTTTARFQTPAGDLQLALGYIRREFRIGSRPIEYTGGIATPATLPFNTSEVASPITPRIL